MGDPPVIEHHLDHIGIEHVLRIVDPLTQCGNGDFRIKLQIVGHLVDQFGRDQGLVTLHVNDPMIRPKTQHPCNLLKTVCAAGVIG